MSMRDEAWDAHNAARANPNGSNPRNEFLAGWDAREAADTVANLDGIPDPGDPENLLFILNIQLNAAEQLIERTFGSSFNPTLDWEQRVDRMRDLLATHTRVTPREI